MARRVVLLALFTMAAILAGGALAQEKAKPPEKKRAQAPPAKGAPQMTPEQKAAMEKMRVAATPGEQHKLLAALAGKWNVEVKMWQAPGLAPDVSHGVSTAKMILGGRYLEESFKSAFMNQPFEGIGYTGYDNVQKKFIGTWMDNMSTGIMTSAGDLDAAGKVMTCLVTYADPQSGKVTTSRDVLRIVDKDKHVMEMYNKGPDGKEFLMMEITYTRAPAAPKK